MQRALGSFWLVAFPRPSDTDLPAHRAASRPALLRRAAERQSNAKTRVPRVRADCREKRPIGSSSGSAPATAGPHPAASRRPTAPRWPNVSRRTAARAAAKDLQVLPLGAGCRWEPLTSGRPADHHSSTCRPKPNPTTRIMPDKAAFALQEAIRRASPPNPSATFGFGGRSSSDVLELWKNRGQAPHKTSIFQAKRLRMSEWSNDHACED